MTKELFNNINDTLADINSYLGLVTCSRMALESENYNKDLITNRIIDCLYLAETALEDKLDMLQMYIDDAHEKENADNL